MSNALQAALRYREMGISVIPCRPDKKPFIQWTEFQKRLPTPDEIRAWWQRWPRAMVAIVTGEISGLCAVDCDTPAGYDAVQKLLPDSFLTPIARTPRGGCTPSRSGSRASCWATTPSGRAATRTTPRPSSERTAS